MFRLSVRTIGGGELVKRVKTVHSYVNLRGRIFRPNSANGIVLARVTWEDTTVTERVGEILEIFSHEHTEQEALTQVFFARIRWYVDMAEASNERAVHIWQYDAYVQTILLILRLTDLP